MDIENFDVLGKVTRNVYPYCSWPISPSKSNGSGQETLRFISQPISSSHFLRLFTRKKNKYGKRTFTGRLTLRENFWYRDREDKCEWKFDDIIKILHTILKLFLKKKIKSISLFLNEGFFLHARWILGSLVHRDEEEKTGLPVYKTVVLVESSFPFTHTSPPSTLESTTWAAPRSSTRLSPSAPSAHCLWWCSIVTSWSPWSSKFCWSTAPSPRPRPPTRASTGRIRPTDSTEACPRSPCSYGETRCSRCAAWRSRPCRRRRYTPSRNFF